MIQTAFQTCAAEGTPFDLELHFTTPKGRRSGIRMIGEPVLENGKVVRVIGVAMNIAGRGFHDRTEQSRG